MCLLYEHIYIIYIFKETHVHQVYYLYAHKCTHRPCLSCTHTYNMLSIYTQTYMGIICVFLGHRNMCTHHSPFNINMNTYIMSVFYININTYKCTCMHATCGLYVYKSFCSWMNEAVYNLVYWALMFSLWLFSFSHATIVSKVLVYTLMFSQSPSFSLFLGSEIVPVRQDVSCSALSYSLCLEEPRNLEGRAKAQQWETCKHRKLTLRSGVIVMTIDSIISKPSELVCERNLEKLRDTHWGIPIIPYAEPNGWF